MISNKNSIGNLIILMLISNIFNQRKLISFILKGFDRKHLDLFPLKIEVLLSQNFQVHSTKRQFRIIKKMIKNRPNYFCLNKNLNVKQTKILYFLNFLSTRRQNLLDENNKTYRLNKTKNHFTFQKFPNFERNL